MKPKTNTETYLNIIINILMYVHVSHVKDNMNILVMTAEEMCTPYFPPPSKETHTNNEQHKDKT